MAGLDPWKEGVIKMQKRYLLAMAAVIMALALASCGNGKSHFSTENLKKYVEKMKEKQTYSDEKTKKALKSIFPKIKLK